MRSRLIALAPTAGLTAILVLSACQGQAGAGSASASASTAATASASASASQSGAGAAQVKVSTTSAGEALVGAGGMTLYFFANDKNGTVACTGSCAQTWHAFTVASGTSATAGTGVTAGWLGTVTRPDDGKSQVTYNGHPVYYFVGDKAAGDANGQGIGGVWFIATASGELPSPSASAGASASGYHY